MLKPWLLTTLIALLLVAGLAGYKTLQVRQAISVAASYPEPSETVEAVTAQQKSWQPQLSAAGEIIAPQALTLRNELEGRIVTLGFEPGARVRKGQLLVELDTSEQRAQLAAAEAQMELAQLALKRYEKLLTQNASSRDRYDQARSELAVASANAEALKAVINKQTLRAPFDAYAGLFQLQEGQFLAADTAITQLVGVAPQWWVDFNLPQQQAAIAIGAKVTVASPELLATPLSGEVIARDAAVTTSSRNLRFRALINDPNRHLRPGMLVDVKVAKGGMQQALMLPATAIRRDNFGSYVYRLAAANDGRGEIRAVRQRISVGDTVGDEVLVLSGIEAGQRFAANGAYKLRDGLLVLIAEQAQP
jgi:membrane fusion protein (multidrug efflux system)